MQRTPRVIEVIDLILDFIVPPHVLRLGLSRSQEVTRTELAEAATIRDAIFRSAKALPRTTIGMSERNWCHFTIPPRPRTHPLSTKAHHRAIS